MSYYDTAYGAIATDAEMRREIYGRDIGQQSWLTAEQQEHFARAAGFGGKTRLLEIGCGAGGPALFLCETMGLTVTGIDSNAVAVETAQLAAKARGLDAHATFHCRDAQMPMGFDGAGFDAVQCIDAINHLQFRRQILLGWAHLLRPGGMVLYTDPVVLTGEVTSDLLAARSAIGRFSFLPAGENETAIRDAGLELVMMEDVTDSEAEIARRRIEARNKRRDALIAAEGEGAFDATQLFLTSVYLLSHSRQLSRFFYLARKP